MFVHASRIQKQFEYLRNLGIDTGPLYRQTGIAKDEDFSQDKHFDFEVYKAILDYGIRQTNNPEYGLDFGDQPQLGGTVGMLSASCANLKEALTRGCEFLKLQGDFAELKFVDDDKYPRLIYTTLESWALESPHTAKLEVDAMFSFLNTILRINSNNTLKAYHIKLACARPENEQKYTEVFGLRPEFEAGANEMIFRQETLMVPMKAFNPETYRLLEQYLQNRLHQLYHAEKVSDKVRRLLHASFKYQFPDIGSVAESLNLSPRTLQRKLSEENTTFKDLLQETRFGLAKELLRQQGFSVSEIGYILGYSDLANFSRSFKKFSGLSPQEFRES